jgi:hypothetical protein
LPVKTTVDPIQTIAIQIGCACSSGGKAAIALHMSVRGTSPTSETAAVFVSSRGSVDILR